MKFSELIRVRGCRYGSLHHLGSGPGAQIQIPVSRETNEPNLFTYGPLESEIRDPARFSSGRIDPLMIIIVVRALASRARFIRAENAPIDDDASLSPLGDVAGSRRSSLAVARNDLEPLRTRALPAPRRERLINCAREIFVKYKAVITRSRGWPSAISSPYPVVRSAGGRGIGKE